MFFGYYFTCCFIIILAALLGTVSGSLTFILGKKQTRTSIWVGIGTALLLLLGICGYWGVYLPNDFYNYAGDFDYYRMPLDYPYELSMVDGIDCANITKWKENDLLITGITHYHKRDNLIVGRISDKCFFPDEPEWFSFDTRIGRVTKYKTEDEFHQALEKFGFNKEPELLTIRENWNLYWSSY